MRTVVFDSSGDVCYDLEGIERVRPISGRVVVLDSDQSVKMCFFESRYHTNPPARFMRGVGGRRLKPLSIESVAPSRAIEIEIMGCDDRVIRGG